MAIYKTGSKGTGVTELQKSLNNSGYGLATDGIYGPKTAAAVKDYQTKNNLTVDGIAGNQTLSSLGGTMPTVVGGTAPKLDLANEYSYLNNLISKGGK